MQDYENIPSTFTPPLNVEGRTRKIMELLGADTLSELRENAKALREELEIPAKRFFPDNPHYGSTRGHEIYQQDVEKAAKSVAMQESVRDDAGLTSREELPHAMRDALQSNLEHERQEAERKEELVARYTKTPEEAGKGRSVA